MTALHPDQITAVETVLKPYIADPKVSVFGAFMEAFNAFQDAVPGRKGKPKADRGEPEGFATFYDAYPLKKGRRDAAKAYGEALKRAPAGIILAGSQRYATEMAGTETKYIKHPGTWLRADCFADVAPTLALVTGEFEDAAVSGWLTRLELYAGKRDAPKGTWRDKWGPKPRDPGCKVPQAAYDEFFKIYPQKGKNTG